MKYSIVFILMFMISCSAPSRRCTYNDCNDCSEINTWKKDIIQPGENKGPASHSPGIKKDRKVRVLAVSSSLEIPLQSDVARSNAKRIAVDEARRQVTKLINLEFSNSQHASGMDGIEILYRGKSFSGDKGRKMFSEIMKNILDDGKQICIDYDIENRRCIVLMEYDLSLFDK